LVKLGYQQGSDQQEKKSIKERVKLSENLMLSDMKISKSNNI